MPSTQTYTGLIFAPKRAQWILFSCVLLICTILASFTELGRETFRYQNDIMNSNEYWRMLSGHFVHLGWSHFLLNMLGFFVLWCIYGGMYSVKQWLLAILLSSLGISVAFQMFDTSLLWYVGMSGLLHTILALAMCGLLLQYLVNKTKHFHWEDIVIMIFLIGKLLFEQIIGPVPLTEASSGGPVVVNAHLYGALMGCICSVFLFKFTHIDNQK